MAFNDAMLVRLANHAITEVTHIQAHSGARGADGTTNAVGAKTAPTSETADADGDITWVVDFTGLGASTAIAEFSYWGDAGATYLGGSARSGGDAAANAAGEVTATITETGTAS